MTKKKAVARANEAIREARELLNVAAFDAQTIGDAYAEGRLLAALGALGVVTVQIPTKSRK
jgi:hypothetical protein